MIYFFNNEQEMNKARVVAKAVIAVSKTVITHFQSIGFVSFGFCSIYALPFMVKRAPSTSS